MPPFVPRKRERSSSPAPEPPAKRPNAKKPVAAPPKRTLFDAADAPARNAKTAAESRKLLDDLHADDDDESSLSEADSDEFEDVFPVKRAKMTHAQDGDEDEEDGMDWEDAIQPGSSANATPGYSTNAADEEIGDLSISVDNSNNAATIEEYTVSAGVNKKGPSKRERQVRVQSHCLHVQALLWHNTIRSSWLSDKETQRILVDGLSEGVKREVTRWREAMGMLTQEELDAKKRRLAAKNKNRKARDSKGKTSGRDWNYDAQHLEQGVPNLSAGDPLLRLLKVLAAFWRKRFTVTAPGLRKQGYKSLTRLRDEVKGWQKDMNDAEEYGERIENRDEFRKLAASMEGSRDVGAQLFVALLRGLGIETRMVANLQPVGFGWSKTEDADPKRPKKKDHHGSEKKNGGAAETPTRKTAQRKSARGNQSEPIDLDDSDSSLSSAPSDPDIIKLDDDDDDDASVIEITPTKPKRKEVKKYDRDLAFPNYWIEACSPVSNKFIPVDPMVLSTIGSNEELAQTFEPRGKKSEKAKQVICYTVAFSADGTAKDVTIRYLKRHQLPGKTKGTRMPVEKVPVHDRRGKVKKYEAYDWFRTVMSLYDRPHNKRTAADDLEDQTDLKPFKAAKEAKEVEKESLQWYKQSAEFVLETHLRREEALVPGAASVKTFTAGKGDKAKDHPVYRRADVVACKTVESWHKEGRELKAGQHPMKLVPMRAVTLVRKREVEDAQRETGEKPKQGLYSRAQTDWIIPPPIADGVIPKNAFGNMDVYVPTMVPRGAVHLPLKGAAKLCRKLDIDYAEACTGFEFGNQRAVPILTGVVVAEEFEAVVRDAWRAYRAEQKRKEDSKRIETSLRTWRKMLLGLRVIQRMKEEYQVSGEQGEEVNPFVARAKREARLDRTADEFGDDGMGGGGFFPPGHEGEDARARPAGHDASSERDDELGGGGFLVDDDEDENGYPEPAGGGFLVEEDAHGSDGGVGVGLTRAHAPVTPVSLQSLHKAPGADDEDASILEDEGEDDDEEDEGVPESAPTRKPRSFSTAKRPRKSAAKTQRRGKATRRKSQYFNNGDDDSEDDDDEDNDASSAAEDEDDEEIVQPRRTTARTRAKP